MNSTLELKNRCAACGNDPERLYSALSLIRRAALANPNNDQLFAETPSEDIVTFDSALTIFDYVSRALIEA